MKAVLRSGVMGNRSARRPKTCSVQLQLDVIRRKVRLRVWVGVYYLNNMLHSVSLESVTVANCLVTPAPRRAA